MERISNIAQRLKEYREQFNLTLADISKKCKIPMQTLNRYELEQRVRIPHPLPKRKPRSRNGFEVFSCICNGLP